MTAESDLTRRNWIRRLGWSLGALPPVDRSEILAEYDTHIDHRLAEGMTLEAALASLGAPEAIGRQFEDDHILARAVSSGGFAPTMRVAARWLNRSAAAVAALFGIGLLGTFAGGVLITAFMKFADPANWGLWSAPGLLLFGRADDPAATEILGAWIYPAALLITLTCWSLARAILVWATARIAGHAQMETHQ